MGKIAAGITMGAKAAGKATAKTDQEALVEAAKAADRAAAGKRAADVAKATAPMKMSEALGNLNVEGKGKLKVTQSDRTRVGGGNIGGAMFPGLSQVDPFYEGLVWGVGKKGTASSLIRQSEPDTYWTTILGKEDQLKSNPIVFNRLYDAFKREAKSGLLDDELRQKINAGLEPTFGEGADILDPKLRQKINTFDKRVLVADLLLGKGIGGEQRGGSIIPGSAILRQETEPLLLHPKQGGDVPTFAVGPRLFSLSGDVKERPDLHPGFPYLLTGEDTGMVFKPVPGEEAMIDFMTRMQEAGKKPGYYEWTMGEAGRGLPSQDITEAYLTYLQKKGYAEGGMASPEGIPPLALDLESEYQSYASGGPVHMQVGGQPPMDEIGYMMEAIDPTKESYGSPTFEAVKFMAPQVVKSLVSPFVGAYGTLTSGKFGTPEGIRAGEAAMEKFMLPGEVDLSPEAAEKVMQAGKFMEELETKYKLPPLMPELFGPAMGARGIGTQVKGLAKDATGMVRDMAKELPPIPAGLSIQPVGQTTEQWLKSLEIPPKPQGSKMEVYAPADDLGLYSKMEKAALNFKRKEGTGDAWLADFKNAGVSDEELEFSGMKDVLARITQPMKRETIAVYAKQRRMPLQVVRATEGTDSRDFKFGEAEVIDDADYIKGRAEDIEADFDNEYPGGSDALRARIMQDFTDDELNDPNILASIEETVQRNIKQESYDRAYTEYYDNPYYKSYNDAGYEIVGNRDVGFTVKDPNGRYLTEEEYPRHFNSLEIAESFANQHALDTGLMKESDVKFSKYQLDRGTDYEEMKILLPQPSGKRSFMGDHWDEEDVLSHYRTQKRVDTSGKPMMYVDEIQSDWHQAGRDRGYFGKPEQERFAALDQQAKRMRDREATLKIQKRQIFKRIDAETEANPPEGAKDLFEVSLDRYYKDPEAQKIEKELAEISDELGRIREKFKEFEDQVPDAPFKDTWHELTVKAILHDATQKGFERVGFSAAKPHIDRWGTEVFAWEKVPPLENTKQSYYDWMKSLQKEKVSDEQFQKAIDESWTDKSHPIVKAFLKAVENSGGWKIVSQEQRGGQAGGVNLEAEARARGILKGNSGDIVQTRDDVKRIVEATLRNPTELKVERITNKVWKSMNKTDVGIHEPRKEGMQYFYDEALKKFLEKYAKKIGANFYETETKTGYGVSDEGPKGITEKVYMFEFTPKAKDTAIKGQPYKKGGAVKKRVGGPIYSPFNTKPDISDAGQLLDFGMEQELKRYG